MAYLFRSVEVGGRVRPQGKQEECHTFFGCAGVPSSVRPLKVACSGSAGSTWAASSAALTDSGAAAAAISASSGAYTDA